MNMNLYDMEIKFSNSKIINENAMIRNCYWGVNLNGGLIIFLIILGYYFNSYDWINGFAIGINILCLIENINSIMLSKLAINCEKARIKLYEEIRKQSIEN